jgi:ATP-dependent DNA helicase RecG
MEIISPGGLLSTINIKDIKSLTGVHQSRNTKIARVLKEIGYMREMGEGMRRIFSLMEQNDLLSPVLKSDSSEFNITLSHKSVYSEEDQRIIQGYNLFKLTREEMFIVLLGKDNKVISPKQIYDNLKLSDWDVYREIVSNLQFKGILKNTLNGIQKKKLARNKNLSQRDIPRIAVRTPSECEDSLTELFETISKLGSFNIISQAYLDECKKALKTENIFKDKSANLYYLFKLIDLIDEEKKPKAQLNEIWKKNNSGIYKKSIKPSMLSDKKTAKNDIPITTKPKSIEAKNQPPIPSTSAIIPKDIFIENLEYHVTSDELKLLFDKYGEVIKVSIPKDFYTGLGRGFGFVIMQNYQEAIDAIHDLNNTNYKGRIIRVNFSTKNQ